MENCTVSLVLVLLHFTEYGMALLLCCSKYCRAFLQYAVDLAAIMLVWESSIEKSFEFQSLERDGNSVVCLWALTFVM